ncbi:MAG: hypothetical protein IJ264_03295, partial [Clostridia bacterium]|nr:hypothetical protein [Clostridia bacterium]
VRILAVEGDRPIAVGLDAVDLGLPHGGAVGQVHLSDDLVGHLLCCLPYLFFWDYTDEKHAEVIATLQERERIANEEEAKEKVAAVSE